jgi:hypothetical protein
VFELLTNHHPSLQQARAWPDSESVVAVRATASGGVRPSVPQRRPASSFEAWLHPSCRRLPKLSGACLVRLSLSSVVDYHGLGIAGPPLASHRLAALPPNRHAVLVSNPMGGLAYCRARDRVTTRLDQPSSCCLAAQLRPEADAGVASLDPRSLGLIR